MNNRPRFFIIAGPNGAGKTTNGFLYLPANLSIFNGDIVFAELIKKYPSAAPLKLQGGVAKALEDARDDALSAKKDFAFETNYSADLATEITSLFKKRGYHTTLIYFGLNSLEESAARVADRNLMGGHDVAAKTIEINFKEGIKRVNKDLYLFDSILFIDTVKQDSRIIAYIQKEPKIQLNLLENVEWYNTHFKKSVHSLNIKPRKKVRQILPEKKKGRGL